MPKTTGLGVNPSMTSFPVRKVATCLGLGALSSNHAKGPNAPHSLLRTIGALPNTYSLLPIASSEMFSVSLGSRHSKPPLMRTLIPTLLRSSIVLMLPAGAVLVGERRVNVDGRFSTVLIDPLVQVPELKPVWLPTEGCVSPIVISVVANDPFRVIGAFDAFFSESKHSKSSGLRYRPTGTEPHAGDSSAFIAQLISSMAAASSARPCRLGDLIDISTSPRSWIARHRTLLAGRG